MTAKYADEAASLPLDACALKAELAAAQAAREDMARELALLRSGAAQARASTAEKTDEVTLLRASLATLASALQSEKDRVAEVERKRREEEDKVNTLRSKVEEARRALMRLQSESSRRAPPPTDAPASSSSSSSSLSSRRGSSSLTTDSLPRRRSSLGPASPLSGLGFGELGDSGPSARARDASQRRSFGTYSTSGNDAPDDRLRNFRLGSASSTSSSSSQSRRNGSIDSDVSFSSSSSRRVSQNSIMDVHRNSISEEDEGEEHEPVLPSATGTSLYARKTSVNSFFASHMRRGSRDSPLPTEAPSASLRLAGRKQSMAVFEATPAGRRDSDDPNATRHDVSAASPSAVFKPRSLAIPSRQSAAELRIQLEGLRIQLAESEEGRGASELCLRALKDFIHTSPALDGVRLPPLPTETEIAAATASPATKTTSRWALPGLPSIPRSPLSPGDVGAWFSNTRRDSILSVASTFSNATLMGDKSTTPSAQEAPSFGGFSFAKVASPSPASAVAPAPEDVGTHPPSPTTATPGDRPCFPSSDSEVSVSSAPSLMTDRESMAGSSSDSDGDDANSLFSDEGRPVSPVMLSDGLVRACELTFGVAKVIPTADALLSRQVGL